MDHNEFNHRIDRLEDSLRGQLNELEDKIDDMGNKMIASTTSNSVKIEGMQGHIRLIWAVIMASVTGAVTYLYGLIK